MTLAEVQTLPRTYVRAAYRTTDHKLVFENGAYKLFSLKDDPFEQNNIWCTAATKAKSEELASSMAAIDSQYPALKCP